MNIFDFLRFKSSPAAATATVPSPQLHLHVTNQNATAGPSRLSPITAKLQPLPFTDEDEEEDAVEVPVGEVDPRLTGGLTYEEIVSRQATALFTLRKTCKWLGCSRELASIDILERHARAHFTYQPDPIIDIEEPSKSTAIICRWGSCRETFDNRGAAYNHLHDHLSWHLRKCPVIGCQYRERVVSRTHLETDHPDLTLQDLPISSKPCFNTAIPPVPPPPLPSLVPGYLLGEVAIGRGKSNRSDIKKAIAAIRPRRNKFFRGASEATSYNRGLSSSIFHVEPPYDEEGGILPFVPVHYLMNDILLLEQSSQRGPKSPCILKPEPTLQPNQPITFIQRERKRQALSGAVDLDVKRRKIVDVVLSSDEQLDRAAAKGAGASFGTAFMFERLRLQGKLDESSPVGDGPF